MENEIDAISWKRILLFFITATIISNIFRFDIFQLKPELQKFLAWLFIFTSVLLEGGGVLIGVLIIIPILKRARKTEMSFFGTSKTKRIIMMVIPIILLSVIGVKNDFKMEYHIYAFISAIGAFIYCVMEEYGWRGYLQEELKILKPWKKYLSIGFIWYLWHLTFLKNVSVGNNLFFLEVLILGSWGIDQVAEFTKSIIASACFHMIIQIMMFNAIIKNGIGSTEKIIILIVSVAIWFVIKQNEKKKTLPQKDIRQTQLAICK